jgi:hypothetical protein
MKKLNLGSIAAAPSSSRSTHPTVTADADTLMLLEQFAQINPQFKTLKNQSETLSKQLAEPIRRMFWTKWNGIAPESSTLLCVAGGRSIKLTCKNAYSKGLADEAPLVAAIGQELTTMYFRQATVLKLELDKMPEDCQEKFATEVLALAAKLGVTDAVTATQCDEGSGDSAGCFGFTRRRQVCPTIRVHFDVSRCHKVIWGGARRVCRVCGFCESNEATAWPFSFRPAYVWTQRLWPLRDSRPAGCKSCRWSSRS